MKVQRDRIIVTFSVPFAALRTVGTVEGILLAAVLVTAYAGRTYAAGMVNFLIYVLPLWLLMAFATMAALAFANRHVIAGRFAGVTRTGWMALGLILVLAFAIRAATPQTDRIYFDEDIFQNIAQNLLTQQRMILCNSGTPTSCDEFILNK